MESWIRLNFWDLTKAFVLVVHVLLSYLRGYLQSGSYCERVIKWALQYEGGWFSTKQEKVKKRTLFLKRNANSVALSTPIKHTASPN